MRSRRDRFRGFRRGVIGAGTFIYAWGVAGVVPIKLPFDLPALPAIAWPNLSWAALRAPAPSSFSSFSAVPEPGSWLLMIAGALMIGLALRSYPRTRLQPAY